MKMVLEERAEPGFDYKVMPEAYKCYIQLVFLPSSLFRWIVPLNDRTLTSWQALPYTPLAATPLPPRPSWLIFYNSTIFRRVFFPSVFEMNKMKRFFMGLALMKRNVHNADIWWSAAESWAAADTIRYEQSNELFWTTIRNDRN